MSTRSTRPMLAKRALRLDQSPNTPLYVFSLSTTELHELADISRVNRNQAGELIGYQRPEVRQHVNEIVDYLNSEDVIFPNPIILALPSSVRFVASRGPKPAHAAEDPACTGTLEIPIPCGDESKPAWIVDGQQRSLALAKARRQDLPVLVTAFIADNVDVQRDQFIRINNTKPLPRGLVTELLPTLTSPLPPKLAINKAPAKLVELLDTQEPFAGLICRPSTSTDVDAPTRVIAYNSLVTMLKDSLTSPGGCLYPYRNPTTSETDYASVTKTVTIYWTAVRDTFPDAWAQPPEESRLMHGAGIRAMGRLMDRIMSPLKLADDATPKRVMDDLAMVAPYCRWTSGTWDGMGLAWDAVQNTSRHVSELTSYLIRHYTQARASQ